MDNFFRLPQEILLFEGPFAFVIYGVLLFLLVLIVLGAEKITYLIVREVKKIGKRHYECYGNQTLVREKKIGPNTYDCHTYQTKGWSLAHDYKDNPGRWDDGQCKQCGRKRDWCYGFWTETGYSTHDYKENGKCRRCGKRSGGLTNETPVHTEQSRKMLEPLPPMPTFPDYTKATPIDQLKISGYQALLFRNVPPIAANLMAEGNCLHFLFALVVVNDDMKPIYAVTSEITDIKQMGNRIYDIFEPNEHDRVSGIFDLLDNGDSPICRPMLCTFAPDGHANFGDSRDWSDKETFLKEAKKIVGEALA